MCVPLSGKALALHSYQRLIEPSNPERVAEHVCVIVQATLKELPNMCVSLSGKALALHSYQRLIELFSVAIS